jgi:hypothetical protein
MPSIRSQTISNGAITIVRSDGATLTVTKADVVALIGSIGIGQAKKQLVDQIAAFLGIDSADITNRMIMDVAAGGILDLKTVW